MGRIIVKVVEDKLIVTRHESEGAIIPDNITQNRKVVAIIHNNLDTDEKEEKPKYKPSEIGVSREEFIIALLSSDDKCKENYSIYGKGLYSMNDMRMGITFAEAAYLLHYVGGKKNAVANWNDIKPREKDRVCVLHDVDGSIKSLDERLASYKSRLDIDRYISSIIAGRRYIPLPLYCAYYDFVCKVNAETGLNINLDMMFKKLSQEEYGILKERGIL